MDSDWKCCSKSQKYFCLLLFLFSRLKNAVDFDSIVEQFTKTKIWSRMKGAHEN